VVRRGGEGRRGSGATLMALSMIRMMRVMMLLMMMLLLLLLMVVELIMRRWLRRVKRRRSGIGEGRRGRTVRNASHHSWGRLLLLLLRLQQLLGVENLTAARLGQGRGKRRRQRR